VYTRRPHRRQRHDRADRTCGGDENEAHASS
jgi:hypothetical protein